MSFHRCGLGLRLAVASCALSGLLVAAVPAAHASDETTRPASDTIRLNSELPAEVQRELAERFSPVLVFHPSEQYFPTNPLFPLEGPSALSTSEPIATRLGTVAERRAYYEGLTLPQKAGLSTVYYRAYHARKDGEPVVVVEYWFYYIFNAYKVRGNVLPFWIGGNHPNDLEHIHVVLHRSGDDEYALHEVYTSAHEGTMPANRHVYDEAHASDRTRFLIERGSHAIAPDVDGDGMFTPGVDGSSGYKVLWGIRDRGITWARYQPAYMDARTVGNSIVFSYAGAPAEQEGYAYRLVPVERLQTSFDELRLSRNDRQAIFENSRHLLSRLFGSNNGSSGKLLVPPPRSEDRNSIGIEKFASTERGFMAGVQLNAEQQGAFVGARYAFLLGGTYVPDVMFQADALFVGTTYLSSQIMIAYPIDGSTTVMVGRGLVTDSLRFENRQWDWVGAVEFPLGRMRLYVSCRSWGPLTKYTQEVRLAYFF